MAYVHVDIDLDDISDNDLISELETRGYIVLSSEDTTDDPLFKLRQSFLLDSPEQFQKHLATFFHLQGIPL